MEEANLDIDIDTQSASTDEDEGGTFKTVQKGRQGQKKKRAQVSTKVNFCSVELNRCLNFIKKGI